MRPNIGSVIRQPRNRAGSYDVQYEVPADGLVVEFDQAEAFEVLSGGPNPHNTRLLLDSANNSDALQSFPCTPGKVHLGPFKRIRITGGDSDNVRLRIYQTRSVAVSTADPAGKPRKLHLLRTEGLVAPDLSQPLSLTDTALIAEDDRRGLNQLWVGQLNQDALEQFDVQRYWSGWIRANADFEVLAFVKPTRGATEDPVPIQRWKPVHHLPTAGLGAWGSEPVDIGAAEFVVDFSASQCFQPGVVSHSTGVGSVVGSNLQFHNVPIPEGAVQLYINWTLASALEFSAEICAVGG